MDSILFLKKGKQNKISKYVIFSFAFVMAFLIFAFSSFSGVKAAPELESVIESNYHGQMTNDDGSKTNVSNNAKAHITTTGDTDLIRYFIQGRGIANKDVIRFKITGLKNLEFERIAIVEEGYSASSDNPNYDSYLRNESGEWVNDASTGGKGLVSCDGLSANSTSLKANGATAESGYDALFCYRSDDTDDTLEYVYTIRSEGYGLKMIYIFLYSTKDGEAVVGDTPIPISLVVSKPISDFSNTVGFTWVNSSSVTCGTNINPTGSPATNNICVNYINGETGNTAKEMVITIPKEVAYLHDVSKTEVTEDSEGKNIKNNNSIYAINTFQGSDSVIKYYYYDFNWKGYTIGTSPDVIEVTGNQNMDEDYYYNLNLMVDSSGIYVFYIKDYFGNTFESVLNNSGTNVEVVDVSIRNLLIDYTNADKLTILSARLEEVASEELFAGNVVVLTYDSPNKVLYVKAQKDETTIVVEVFSKIVIENGKFYCGTDITCQAIAMHGGENVENIRKEAINAEDDLDATDGHTKYWKNDASSLENKDIPDTATNVSRGTYIQGNSYINSEYNATGRKNRLEINFTSNGRYRFTVTDKYGNTTDAVKGDINNTFRNPCVDVTVIDATIPTLATELSGNGTTIDTYDYVIGGGEGNVAIDLIQDKEGENTAIYYNVNGSKYFNYEDAIKIAQLNAADSTTFSSYSMSYLHSNGVYSDTGKGLFSDRNSDETTTVISGENLHNYILKNGISSFSAGMVIPETSADITTNGQFTIGATEYTITYTNDKPTSINPGNITVSDNGDFVLGGKNYYIAGTRIVSYDVKVPVSATTYTATADDYYLFTDSLASGGDASFVNSLDVPAYNNTYIGFVEIRFLDADNNDICSVGLDVTTNQNCFKEINKRIDTVADTSSTNASSFKMVFTVYDYVGHVSSEMTVTVNVIDNTAPGFIPPSSASEKDGFRYQGEIPVVAEGETTEETPWTNKFDDSLCMLEIGNKIQSKTVLINCYLIGRNVGTGSASYHFKDNNTNHPNATEQQLYELSEYTNYFDSIKLEIEKDDGTFVTVTDDAATHVVLSKAGQHKLKITIYDNWDIAGEETVTGSVNNQLEITVEYYVNPRTLLIKPIANEKVYGENDPEDDATDDKVFDFCVYINRDNTTFNRTGEFFDLDFVNQYFKMAYCTKDEYYSSEYSDMTTNDITNVLLNGNAFTGSLSRVESAWYNGELRNLTGSNSVQNNYVGYYNIVLGSLAIDPNTGSGGSGEGNYANDYVIKIDPRNLLNDVDDGADKSPIQGTTQVNGVQTQNKELENDLPLTESNIQFTIKQAILEITATGGNKTFGEQDSNSHNWNTTTTVVNSASTSGYLGGYIVTGLKKTVPSGETAGDNSVTAKYYDDDLTKEIILGVLRRQIGEDVGKYMICNISSSTPQTEVGCNLGYSPSVPASYSTEAGKTYMYLAYDKYGLGGENNGAALTININSSIYGTVTGKSLNTGNRNYVIKFNLAHYLIEAGEMIIQPGVNQGKEYSKNPYNDPIWQLVVYGETVTCSDVKTCTSNVAISTDANGFSGYTATINPSSYTDVTIDHYRINNDKTKDTDIYYNRRKTSPDVIYTYKLDLTLQKDASNNYTNIYTKSGDYYYLEKSTTAINKYVYAYGTYHEITSSNLTSDKVTIEITGHLVNQTYTLFYGEDNSAGTATLTRTSGENVGWYTFNAINNNSTNFKLATNSNAHCTILDNSISIGGGTDTSGCKNYSLTFESSAPDEYLDSNGAEVTEAYTYTKAITIQGMTNEYKPNGFDGCYTNGNTAYTSQCNDADKSNVLFEIFKREIVISFDASNYIFIYGHRYDYYDGGVSFNGEYNIHSNGIFNIKDATSEGDIFICYDENKVAVNCTANPDYGITEGDSWTNIQLEFYMHKNISTKASSNYYDSSEDYALPAGTYYVYANISEEAKANYKFTYLGGELKIEPKVTSIQLTSYTMEYKDAGGVYHSYGLGSNYSEFIEYVNRCMVDSNYLPNADGSTNPNLITITDCLNMNNVVGNTYGFVVEGLDSKDTIAENFTGRPQREAGVDVGYYKIGVGSIGTIKHFTITNLNDNECIMGDETDCIFVKDTQDYNYDITYSLNHNEGGYLFITPATITIDVVEDQTKMYGCAYSSFNVTSNYPYTITGGYANCDQENTAPNMDISYKYIVSGDKDYGSNYEVVGDMPQSSLANSSLQGSLYRVVRTDSSINFANISGYSAGDIYQGQSVGQYIITLGDLNAEENGKTMCDAYNNPAVNGTITCRNYNLNYYGQSASTGVENGEHVYTSTTSLTLDNLKTYDLNYVADANGTYVFINGKYVSLTELNEHENTNYYVPISSLIKYDVTKDYAWDNTNGTYILIDREYKLLSEQTKYNESCVEDTNGTYIKVGEKCVAIANINKYSKIEENAKYVENVEGTGKYVYINGKYVSLDSLKKYSESSGVYTESSTGEYVLIYGTGSSGVGLDASGLVKYKLDPTAMYVARTDGNGAYIFINGAYVLRSSVIANSTLATQFTFNSAMNKDGNIVRGNTISAGTDPLTKVIFTITKRDVHVHTEYNVKYVGNEDPVETITCEQIRSAYGLTHTDSSDILSRSSYCNATSISLGVARYYAVDNSLAKYPWTSWVDKMNTNYNFTGVTGTEIANYNDTQFDVLTGQISRYGSGVNDVVGKYTYDYAGIKVQTGTNTTGLSGFNYIIKIETSVDFDETYIKTGTDTYEKLNTFTRYADSSGTIVDNENGYYIEVGGEIISISLVDKYKEIEGVKTSINFWYLGFYAEDDREGRNGELKKWWNKESIFANHYNQLISGTLTEDDGYLGIHDPDFSEKREVYFEIVRRTIYLYAVDNEKIYGIPDKYDDFKVAICATENGYEVDATGIKCRDGDGYDSEVYGLSEAHKGIFYDTNGYMKQETIKGGNGYIFIGTADNSFKIYFKRTAGENVGIYSVTACATQTGISDCTDPAQEEQPGTSTIHIGDNYKIIEIAGTMTINTRMITVIPDSDQGFMYGNYPNNGAIPAITYEEYFEYVDSANLGTQGVVNSGSSSDASNIATCLFNISGESVVCINDNQNDIREIDEREYLGTYAEDIKNNAIANAVEIQYKNSVYKDTYSDPDNLASRTESDTRYALNRVCGTTESLRYSRDVCNYVIVAGELSEGSTWVENTINEYVRIVKSNIYDRVGSDYILDTDDNGTWLKVGSRYYEITAANRYTYSYVQKDTGAYLKVDNDYYKIVGANRYSDASCSTRNLTGNYFKEGDISCTEIVAANRYDKSKTLTQNNEGEFLKVGGDTDKVYNYTISKFITGVEYIVTSATLQVEPVQDQYKIYGEADPEIKFNVATTYTVESDHLIPISNVSSILNSDGSTVTLESLTKYTANYTESVDGTYYNVTVGQVVTLVGYAYEENGSDPLLNYGQNYTSTKHDKEASELVQSTSGAIHYDKYSTYNTNIDTSRILIGNLYVEDHNQNVGVRTISNGFIVGNNNYGNKNYLLPAENVNSTNVTFTIIPRPIYVHIEDITKTYGQATDNLSCDVADGCTVADGILDSGAEGQMQYNYTIISTGITLPDASQNSPYTETTINLPSIKSSQKDIYTTYTDNKYYTLSEEEETKNNDLDIKVERGNYNITRATDVCFVSGENTVRGTGKGCEDAGSYYLRLSGNRNKTLSGDPVSVSSYYYEDYWGYNTNYYVIITNNTPQNKANVSEDTTFTEIDTTFTSINADSESYFYDEEQNRAAILTINKKDIEMIVETFTSRGNVADNTRYVGTLGEAYNIEQNMDVPALPVVSNSETHTTYQYITWANHPAQVRTADNLVGYVAYCQTVITNKADGDATIEETVQKYVNCSDLVYHHSVAGDDNSNDANTGPRVFDTSVAGYYAIVRNKDVLYIKYNDSATITNGDYEANNYNTTFYNGILQIDADLTAPVIFAGTEYYAVEANSGELTDMNDFSEEETLAFLNALKTNLCNTMKQDGEMLKVDCSADIFTMAIPVSAGGVFKLDAYEYTISGSTITSSRIGFTGETITDDQFDIDGITYTIIRDTANTPLFIVREGSEATAIDQDSLTTLLSWFNISSHDPSVVRAGINVGKRYDARYYIAIDANFNQRVVGDYTLFVYATDNVGNISRATTVTLRIKDTTKPEVGYLNLFEGQISCDYNTENCVSEGWVGTSHTKWSNNGNGIWLSVTGGRDNTINYLNIDGRTRYSLNGGNFSINASGTYILLGTVVDIRNLTQYYKQDDYYMVTDPNKTYPDGTTIYIRYNGEYKDITSFTRYSLSGNDYTVDADGIYIVDGAFKEIPTQKYSLSESKLVFAPNGTYIKLDQWDHYFSRDNGATWIKYDRETQTGYLALGSDGKRLILIKAVDQGVEYTLADSVNTVDGTAGHHFSNTYLRNDGVWNVEVETSKTYQEYTIKTIQNNVSDWASDPEDNYYRDRKYAYLDTQSPLLELDSNSLLVFEYGCSDCNNGYAEEYGKTIDQYLFEISLFRRYNDENGTIVSTSGNYIKVTIKDAITNKDKDLFLSITNRTYDKNETITTQSACTGKWVNGACYTLNTSNTGAYVYIGNNIDVSNTVDSLTSTIVAAMGTTISVYTDNGTDGDTPTNIIENISLATSAGTSEQIETSTIYEVSGISGSNLMTGTQFANKDLEDLDYVHKKVIIYLTVNLPASGITGELSKDIFGEQTNSSKTYYKYEISCTSDTACTITGWYSTSDNKLEIDATNLNLNLGTFDSLTSAINKIITNTLVNNENTFNNKDLVYSVNYTTTDMAGNISETEVRGVIFSGFLEMVQVQISTGEETQSLYNSYSIEINQNTSALSLLQGFRVTTNVSNIKPMLDRNIVQTVYYNDVLVGRANSAYDHNTISQLDTSVPGTYKIVYSIRKIMEGNVVYSDPFELTVNIKPNVAQVENGNNYIQIAMIGIVGLSTVLAGLYVVLNYRKKKI